MQETNIRLMIIETAQNISIEAFKGSEVCIRRGRTLLFVTGDELKGQKTDFA